MTKEEFLATAARHYDSIKSLEGLDSFYDYEKQFVSILHQLGRDVMEQSLGELPRDHRKKNFRDDPGRVGDIQ